MTPIKTIKLKKKTKYFLYQPILFQISFSLYFEKNV